MRFILFGSFLLFFTGLLSAVKAFLPALYHYGVYEFCVGLTGKEVKSLQGETGSLAAFFPNSPRYFNYHHIAGDIFEKVT